MALLKPGEIKECATVCISSFSVIAINQSHYSNCKGINCQFRHYATLASSSASRPMLACATDPGRGYLKPLCTIAIGPAQIAPVIPKVAIRFTMQSISSSAALGEQLCPANIGALKGKGFSDALRNGARPLSGGSSSTRASLIKRVLTLSRSSEPSLCRSRWARAITLSKSRRYSLFLYLIQPNT